MTLAKPTPRERAKPTRPLPKCECGHTWAKHEKDTARGCWANVLGRMCACLAYTPARRSPLKRASAPIKLQHKYNRQPPKPRCKNCGHQYSKHSYGAAPSKPACLRCAECQGYEPMPIKRKTMPRCKTCADPYRRHALNADGKPVQGKDACANCSACEGYVPARGIRQKRRTPQAAIRRIADGLWADVVHNRRGGCEVQRYHAHACGGSLQAMHGIPRTFSATRWLPINGFRGCQDVHYFFTNRPEAWSALLLEAWGLETFRELWALARASQPVDMDLTVSNLRAELARVEG